jgi:hypothetical protein
MRSALRLIPLMVIGAVAAFLLVGPLTSLLKTHAVASRPQPIATIDPHATPTSCPANLPMPKSAPVVIPANPSLPFPIWVNDPLGVNLRNAPAATGARLATLTQGTRATADQKATDAGNNPWYHVALASQSGWVRADFVTSSPVQPASGLGWSLMLPQGEQLSGNDPSLTTVGRRGDDLPFLMVQASTADMLAVQLPSSVRPDIAPAPDHSATIQVWNYTVVEHVARVALDTCKVSAAWARPDQGWPYMTSVFVHTVTRNYQFTFFTSDPNSPLVKQVLNSVALS